MNKNGNVILDLSGLISNRTIISKTWMTNWLSISIDMHYYALPLALWPCWSVVISRHTTLNLTTLCLRLLLLLRIRRHRLHPQLCSSTTAAAAPSRSANALQLLLSTDPAAIVCENTNIVKSSFFNDKKTFLFTWWTATAWRRWMISPTTCSSQQVVRVIVLFRPPSVSFFQRPLAALWPTRGHEKVEGRVNHPLGRLQLGTRFATSFSASV